MSKITKAKKEAKLKGKAKKIADSQARKALDPEATKPSIPNADCCCHCKHYGPFPDSTGHQCKLSGKPTPRKATCPKHAFKA